jgi:hypothetical protein
MITVQLPYNPVQPPYSCVADTPLIPPSRLHACTLSRLAYSRASLLGGNHAGP